MEDVASQIQTCATHTRTKGQRVREFKANDLEHKTTITFSYKSDPQKKSAAKSVKMKSSLHYHPTATLTNQTLHKWAPRRV